MAKVRVYELAKELGVESKVLLAHLKSQGEFVRSASSTIEPPVVRKIKETFPTELRSGGDGKAAAKTAVKAPPAPSGAAPAKATPSS
ncbi:MAG TPA: translation initiation factor IF-2 N-terminal domain-containing protein, partial [Intrasporangium sp.]|uniref:translation initiation factor IF-2 N-terminal domain-containing protein n=1 Tax=Intrasporangium sp. TaxID=1925024 RepID=UPI002B48669D